MRKLTYLLVVAMLSATAFISCKEGKASEKVKEKNIKVAKERDKGIKKGAAVAEFDKTEHDFGTVAEGTVVETSFMIKNTGKVDLVVTNATATCGCTVPSWPKEPIKPGESGEVKVRFDSAGKPNRQSKTITLFTNTATGRETVKIFGNVTPKAKA